MADFVDARSPGPCEYRKKTEWKESACSGLPRETIDYASPERLIAAICVCSLDDPSKHYLYKKQFVGARQPQSNQRVATRGKRSRLNASEHVCVCLFVCVRVCLCVCMCVRVCMCVIRTINRLPMIHGSFGPRLELGAMRGDAITTRISIDCDKSTRN